MGIVVLNTVPIVMSHEMPIYPNFSRVLYK